MELPLVSIIIPAYNSMEFVEETLESALKQVYPNIEIILVNDGSTDKIESFFSKFEERGVICLSQENNGASTARNLGLSMAKGEFIQFLDADDILHPEKISKQVKLMLAEKTDLSFTFWKNFSQELGTSTDVNFKNVNFNQIDSGYDLIRSLGKDNWFVLVHAWLAKKNLLIKSGPWNESLTNNDDGEYFCRVLLNCEKVSILKEPLVYYRVSDDYQTLSAINSESKANSALKSWRLIAQHIAKTEDKSLMTYPKKGLYKNFTFTRYSSPKFAKLFAKDFDKIKAGFFADQFKYYWLFKCFGLYYGELIYRGLVKLRIVKSNKLPL